MRKEPLALVIFGQNGIRTTRTVCFDAS